ncbi:MAG: extracellular solute-binding protein [Candidatus Dojkabacteria bacterium]|nr:MAG: extracellular solute-binding protein [Candidatus Dojkabacteria bacterium]
MNNKRGPLLALLIIGIVTIVAVIAFFVYQQYNKSGSSGGSVELNYIGLWDDASIYEPLIQEYQNNNPHVKIIYTKATFKNSPNLAYQGVHQVDMEERLNSGTVDIVRVHQAWVAKLLPQLAPAPNTVMTGVQARDLYYPAIADAITSSNNQVFASPQIIDGLVLLYNKDLFDKAEITDPRTATRDWDVTLQTALQLSEKNTNGTIKVAGINMGSFSNVRSSPEILLAMLTQASVPIVTINQTNGAVSATFATDGGVAAVNRFFEFSRVGAWSSRMEDDLQAFASGRLAMMIAPSWRVIDLVGMNSSLRFEALPIPVLPGANPGVPQYYASYWVDVVSKKSKNPEEAWKFLKWLGEPEQLRRIYAKQTELRIIGNPYPIKSMASEQQDAPYIGAIIEMAPGMKSWPLFDYGIWEETLRREFLQYEDRGAVTRNELEQIQSQINNLTLKR